MAEKLRRYNLEPKEESEHIDPVEKSKDNIRNNFRKKQKGVFTKESAAAQTRQSNIRLVQIIAVLTIIAYLILKSDVILNFVQKISG